MIYNMIIRKDGLPELALVYQILKTLTQNLSEIEYIHKMSVTLTSRSWARIWIHVVLNKILDQHL